VTDVTAIPLSKLYQFQQYALMRLMLFITGRVHEITGEFSKQAKAIVLAEANKDGKLDASGAYRAQVEIAKVWGDALKDLTTLISRGMREGASMPFGVQAAYHQELIVPAVTQDVKEAVVDGVFETTLEILIDAAMRTTGPDGMQYSSRIWKLDRESREGINTAIMSAVTDKKSAWQLAKDISQYVGAGQDCPKWTYARLNVVTPADKAKGDMTGLLSGEDCGGTGVSYNALRLARTEIQRTHHLANDNRMAAMPWIDQERIVLSGSHPEEDICDEVVNGGENGDGVYPKGTIVLPLHPHCFCDKRAVQDLDAFGDKLSDWVRTGEGFPEMDTYSASLGADFGSSLLNSPVAKAFGVWAFDQFEEISARMKK